MTKELEFRLPWEIRYRKCEVEWLLSHLDALKVGSWPVGNAPSDKRYTQAFEDTALLIAAEIRWRLEETGIDGSMAKYYLNGKSEEKIGDQFHLEPVEVLNRIQKAIQYMSGWRRKKRTYREWKGHRKARGHGS